MLHRIAVNTGAVQPGPERQLTHRSEGMVQSMYIIRNKKCHEDTNKKYEITVKSVLCVTTRNSITTDRTYVTKQLTQKSHTLRIQSIISRTLNPYKVFQPMM